MNIRNLAAETKKDPRWAAVVARDPKSDGKFFYFTRRSWDAELWRVPVGGGEEVSVLGPGKEIHRRNWALTDRGVFFAAGTDARQVIEFFSFDTGKITPVFTPEKLLVGGTPGLSVSPDGRWLAESRRPVRVPAQLVRGRPLASRFFPRPCRGTFAACIP